MLLAYASGVTMVDQSLFSIKHQSLADCAKKLKNSMKHAVIGSSYSARFGMPSEACLQCLFVWSSAWFGAFLFCWCGPPFLSCSITITIEKRNCPVGRARNERANYQHNRVRVFCIYSDSNFYDRIPTRRTTRRIKKTSYRTRMRGVGREI